MMPHQSRTPARRRSVVVALMCATAAVLISGQSPAAATHAVTEVQGSAFGYHAYEIQLFGTPQPDTGPEPVATLAGDASNSPQSASADSGQVQYGPATFFSSGPIAVNTEGALGETGTVTSTADIQDINTSGNEVFTADNLSATCNATATGATGSTTIVNGTLQTSEGDPDVEGDETVVDLPENPAPNTSYEGQLESTGDSFRYVFNEQVTNADGSITVNAAHQYLLGPTATGHVVLGQTVCGATAGEDAGDTGTTTTTTTAPGTAPATTVPATVTGPVRTARLANTGVESLPMVLASGALLLSGATLVRLGRQRSKA